MTGTVNGAFSLSLSLSDSVRQLLLNEVAAERRYGTIGLNDVELGRRVHGLKGGVGDGGGEAVDDRRLRLVPLVRHAAAGSFDLGGMLSHGGFVSSSLERNNVLTLSGHDDFWMMLRGPVLDLLCPM